MTIIKTALLRFFIIQNTAELYELNTHNDVNSHYLYLITHHNTNRNIPVTLHTININHQFGHVNY